LARSTKPETQQTQNINTDNRYKQTMCHAIAQVAGLKRDREEYNGVKQPLPKAVKVEQPLKAVKAEPGTQTQTLRELLQDPNNSIEDAFELHIKGRRLDDAIELLDDTASEYSFESVRDADGNLVRTRALPERKRVSPDRYVPDDISVEDRDYSDKDSEANSKMDNDVDSDVDMLLESSSVDEISVRTPDDDAASHRTYRMLRDEEEYETDSFFTNGDADSALADDEFSEGEWDGDYESDDEGVAPAVLLIMSRPKRKTRQPVRYTPEVNQEALDDVTDDETHVKKAIEGGEDGEDSEDSEEGDYVPTAKDRAFMCSDEESDGEASYHPDDDEAAQTDDVADAILDVVDLTLSSDEAEVGHARYSRDSNEPLSDSEDEPEDDVVDLTRSPRPASGIDMYLSDSSSDSDALDSDTESEDDLSIN
jgi:hypothetical protein